MTRKVKKIFMAVSVVLMMSNVLMADDVDNARIICKSFDDTGVLTKPCNISTGFYDLSIEITANMTPLQARGICTMYSKKSLGVAGWNLKIYSPYSNGNTIAQCKLR